MNKKTIFLLVVIFFVVGIGLILSFLMGRDEQTLYQNKNLKGESDDMNDSELKIKVDVNGVFYTATLIGNETTKELIDRLPLTITMKELNGNEKYYYFDDMLPSNPNRVGEINTGDIMLYGDACLVLFYDDFETSYHYTKIGSIDNPNNLKDIVGSGNITVTIYQ